jgi:hypothetical protein
MRIKHRKKKWSSVFASSNKNYILEMAENERAEGNTP